MLLCRRNKGLDDIDVALPAVGVQLDLEAVVAESGDLDRRDADPEGVADGASKLAVGTATEDDDLAHEQPLGWAGPVPAAAYPAKMDTPPAAGSAVRPRAGLRDGSSASSRVPS